MTYDASSLAVLIRRCLDVEPLTRLSGIATAAGVDRHTLTRALREINHMTFRELRGDVMRERVEMLKASHTPKSVKEIAFELGYKSANSLSRRQPGINDRRLKSQATPESGKSRRS